MCIPVQWVKSEVMSMEDDSLADTGTGLHIIRTPACTHARHAYHRAYIHTSTFVRRHLYAHV